MTITFTPEHEAFRQVVRDFVTTEINPFCDEWEAAGIFPAHDLFPKLAAIGAFGLEYAPEYGGQGADATYTLVLGEELGRADCAGVPLAVAVQVGMATPALHRFGSEELKQRYLVPAMAGQHVTSIAVSEPGAGSDVAGIRTRAVRDGDDYVITGHKVWTSYSDLADWCLVLARTEADVPKHKGISAFAIRMDQPGIEQRPLKMINGITREFGEVIFDEARVPAANMIGEPGEGWPLAMTVVSHEREPGELGYVARYRKVVKELAGRVAADPDRHGVDARRDLARAYVQAEMLRSHVARRLSDRYDGITHGPEGSVDKLLMTWAEQAVGHAALSVGGLPTGADPAHGQGEEDDTWLRVYLYSRAQSVMGGTSQIQRNLVATRIMGLPR